MKFSTLVLSAAATFTGLLGITARADNMVSISIAPLTGAVTLVPRWATGPSLSGFHFMAQDLSLGGGANQFYSIKGTAIPAGGDISAFTRYISTSGAATPHADIGSKLTPDSYSALTSADPDLGYGSVNFYLIHRRATGDYLTVIKPSSGTASAVTDLKPMSGPGGPSTLGASGYFGLTFAAANLGYGLNYFYYLRTDPVTGFTKFGTLEPALLGTAADKFDLGIGGFNALAFTGSDVGYGTDKMYYLRLDPVTGFTIMGTLHPLTGRASDIANLGSVFSALTYVPGDAGFGTNQFYSTGAVNTTWQSVSFAALADRAISAGSFTVAPSASSTLPITLTVVSGSVGAASISGPVGGVFTVTPTAPGRITLQATQAGQAAPVAYEYNMLRQSFTVTGVATLAITTQPTSQSSVAGGTATLTVAASGTTAVSYQWRKAGINITGNASATTPTLTLSNVQGIDSASYDVVVTNASGSILSNPVTLTVTGAAPVITNSPLTASGAVGTAFNFTITASGTATSYSATPLPSGLVLNTSTGAITGTPTTAGTTSVSLGATSGTGTGNATLIITVAAATGAPVITNTPAGTNSPATAGTSFNYAVVASGSPTSYTATPLPAGLSINATTGVISGTPTTAGTTTVNLGATNSAGTATTTLTITVAAAVVAPVITNTPAGTSSPATASTPFNYAVVASGSPTSYTATPLPAGLSINATTGVISGTPTTAGTTTVTLTATNAGGTATTTLVVVVAPVPSSRIVNFAARAISGPGSQTLIMGFVVSGDGKNLLVRGIGPTLSSWGITNALADPMLTLFNISGALASNDNWQTTTGGQDQSASIATTAARVGAFALPNGSRDSALLYTVNNGAHTTGLLRPNSTTGVALIEVYDTDTVLGSRLVNVSARMNVTPGEGMLIAGLVVAGNASKKVLIRGVGPALGVFDVTGVLADPQIAILSGASVIASNDNWETGASTSAQIITASAQVGAFVLPAGSRDAALLVVLQPGAYTVQVTGVGNTSGVVLIEVYDAP